MGTPSVKDLDSFILQQHRSVPADSPATEAKVVVAWARDFPHVRYPF